MVSRGHGPVPIFRWLSLPIVAMASAACVEGDDDGPFIADPEFSNDVTAQIQPGFRFFETDLPGPTDPAPSLELAGGSPRRVGVAGEVVEWRFLVESSTVGALEDRQLRFQIDDATAHLGTPVSTASSASLSIDLARVGIGVVGLRATVVDGVLRESPTGEGDPVPETQVAEPIALELEIISPSDIDDDISRGIPTGYDVARASCSETSSITVDRFAFDAQFGLCFFVRERARFDCSRCDDVGVNDCSVAACGLDE